MTSLGCKVDESVNRGNGPYVFKIQGCLSHLAGSLLPQEGESPVYAQLYIYDPAEALDHCMQHKANRGLNCQVMADLQDMLYHLHPATQLYKQAYKITCKMPNHQQCRIALHYDKECDQPVEMARGFSVSVTFIHSIRLYTMSFFFQLGNLDGVQIFPMPAEKTKHPGMKVLMMEVHLMASAPV